MGETCGRETLSLRFSSRISPLSSPSLTMTIDASQSGHSASSFPAWSRVPRVQCYLTMQSLPWISTWKLAPSTQQRRWTLCKVHLQTHDLKRAHTMPLVDINLYREINDPKQSGRA